MQRTVKMKKANPAYKRKFLSKTQEVLYQKEFKHADQVYRQLSGKKNQG